MNNKYLTSINYLISKKTQNIPHSGKSFFQHLLNVYNTLRNWNCSEDVCYAGLFHSIYGNETFQIKTEENREVIINLIGKNSEKIVYDFNKNRMSTIETRVINFANNLDHSFINCLDNNYDEKTTNDFYIYFRDQAPWVFDGGGGNGLWRKFIYHLKFENEIETKLKKFSSNIIQHYGLNEFVELKKTYASANPFGTVHESHPDTHKLGNITVMFYLNKIWNLDYSGETVFYDQNKFDIVKSIIPKPARAVIFDNTIYHCARDVRRDVNDLRIVVTFKYYVNLEKTKLYSPW